MIHLSDMDAVEYLKAQRKKAAKEATFLKKLSFKVYWSSRK